MRISPVFEKVFSRIYGKPCWQVRPGHGTFLTFEFGRPHLDVREPIATTKRAAARVRARLARRSVSVHGDWHLWICCCRWEVLNHGKRVGDSSRKATVRRAAETLDGQKLTQVSIAPRKMECVFRFDLGGMLRTYPDDKESEQWLLYEPSHKVLVLRADGRYKRVRSDMRDDSGKWKRIISG